MILLFSPTLFAKKVITCSINPVSAIVREISGTAAEVKTLAGSGASPHTYSLKPSDLITINVSDHFFYLGAMLDPWAESIDIETKTAIISLMPDSLLMQYQDEHSHDHGDSHEHHDHSDVNIDPHFWLDPILVKALVPSLRDKLIEIDPKNANIYRANADAFLNKLDLTHKEVERMLRDLRGKPVYQFHPSFNYFLKRYKLINAGVIEKIPGTGPTVKHTADLISQIRTSGANAIFTEPQLPKKSAELIAKEAGVHLYELDPVGGIKNREKYSDLILYNAKILKSNILKI